MSRAQGLRRIGELLAPALPAPARADVLLPLLRVWPAAVGEAIARETRPARVAGDGTVVVHVTSSIWASELTLMAASVAERVGSALDAPPPTLRFQVGPVPQAVTVAPVRPVPPEAMERARAVAAGVADAELREAIERALARALVRSAESMDSA